MLPPLYQVMEAEGMQLTPGRGATGYSGVFQQGSRFGAFQQIRRKEVSGRVRLGWYSTAVEAAVAVARHRLQHGVPTHWKRKSDSPPATQRAAAAARRTARLQQAEDGVPKRKPKGKPKQRKPERKSGALFSQAVDQPLPCEGSDTESPTDDENEDVLPPDDENEDVLPPLSQEEWDLLCG